MPGITTQQSKTIHKSIKHKDIKNKRTFKQPEVRKTNQEYNTVNSVSSIYTPREQAIQAKEEEQQTKPSRIEKEEQEQEENKIAIDIGRMLWNRQCQRRTHQGDQGVR